MGIFWVADYDSDVRIGKIQNLVSELQNSKWRIQNGGYISANSQFFLNCAGTWCMGVFGVADYESGVRIVKFEMED